MGIRRTKMAKVKNLTNNGETDLTGMSEDNIAFLVKVGQIAAPNEIAPKPALVSVPTFKKEEE